MHRHEPVAQKSEKLQVRFSSLMDSKHVYQSCDYRKSLSFEEILGYAQKHPECVRIHPWFRVHPTISELTSESICGLWSYAEFAVRIHMFRQQNSLVSTAVFESVVLELHNSLMTKYREIRISSTKILNEKQREEERNHKQQQQQQEEEEKKYKQQQQQQKDERNHKQQQQQQTEERNHKQHQEKVAKHKQQQQKAEQATAPAHTQKKTEKKLSFWSRFFL